MIKALLLIFDPIRTWDEILRVRRSTIFILVAYLMPLILLTSVAEGYGLVHWGKWQGDIGRLKKFPVGEAVLVEIIQIILSLFVVFLGAKLLKSIGETFHGRHTFNQAFTAVAYGLGPFFLFRLLDAFAGVSPWVSWAIGISLSVAVMYQGVPRMMDPDPSHAFGLYLMNSLLLILVTGLVRVVMYYYLKGEFPGLQTFIADLGARLPF
jgi:hypothetical protein